MSNPAQWLLWAGAILAILAALAMLFVRPSAILVRAAERNDATYLQFLAEDAGVMDITRPAPESGQTARTA